YALPRLDYRRLPQPLELPPRDFRPLAGVVELQVTLPVVDCLERLSGALAEERQIEMRVRIPRIQVQRLAVMVERFDDAALLVVEVAEVELCQWVGRVRRNRVPIIALGL